ncbi:hypothetical protein [Peptacetobacter sp.]|uniref:hypothetical protein n=1 Tax=Peptacetobacter sp. TaxID=2991975 RepID=UPI003AB81C8D
MEKYKFKDIAYICSIIEYIVRIKFLPRAEVVKLLGKDNIYDIYYGAEVWHCYTYQATASIFSEKANIPYGIYDFVQRSKVKPLNPRALGNIWAKLAIYIAEKEHIDIIDAIYDVFSNSNIEYELENSKDVDLIKDEKYVQSIYKRGYVDSMNKILSY